MPQHFCFIRGCLPWESGPNANTFQFLVAGLVNKALRGESGEEGARVGDIRWPGGARID